MANIEGMIKEAIKAYRKGNRAEARALLEKVVELDQYNEQAWLWLSAVVDTEEEQRTCLENVLVINENNASARSQLAKLNEQVGGGIVDSDFEEIFSDIDFSQGTAFVAPSTEESSPFDDSLAFTEEADSAWEAPPTASSAASSLSFQAHEEPSHEDYDDWVNNLNLGGGQASNETSSAPTSSPAPAFDDVDALFGAEEEDDPFAEAFDSISSGSMSPFSAPIIEEPPSAVFTEAPTSSPAPPPTTPAASMPLTSPVTPTPPLSEEVGDFGGGAFVSSQYDSYEETTSRDEDVSTYFAMLPKGLKPGRLPGEVERYPLFIIVGLALLILLNIGALGLVISRLLS